MSKFVCFFDMAIYLPMPIDMLKTYSKSFIYMLTRFMYRLMIFCEWQFQNKTIGTRKRNFLSCIHIDVVSLIYTGPAHPIEVPAVSILLSEHQRERKHITRANNGLSIVSLLVTGVRLKRSLPFLVSIFIWLCVLRLIGLYIGVK